MKLANIFIEGKAIELTQDMKDFAREAVDQFVGELTTSAWEIKNYGKYRVDYRRKVDGGKRGSGIVTVAFVEPDVESPAGNAEIFGKADSVYGLIRIFINPLKAWVNLKRQFENHKKAFKDMRYKILSTIYHELVHIFDPKVAMYFGITPGNYKTELVNDIENYSGYAKQPHEVDAFVRQYAEKDFKQLIRDALVRHKHGAHVDDFNMASSDKKTIVQLVKNELLYHLTYPDSEILKIYKYMDKTAWKKYKRTIYEIYRNWAEKKIGGKAFPQ